MKAKKEKKTKDPEDMLELLERRRRLIEERRRLADEYDRLLEASSRPGQERDYIEWSERERGKLFAMSTAITIEISDIEDGGQGKDSGAGTVDLKAIRTALHAKAWGLQYSMVVPKGTKHLGAYLAREVVRMDPVADSLPKPEREKWIKSIRTRFNKRKKDDAQKRSHKRLR